MLTLDGEDDAEADVGVVDQRVEHREQRLQAEAGGDQQPLRQWAVTGVEEGLRGAHHEVNGGEQREEGHQRRKLVVLLHRPCPGAVLQRRHGEGSQGHQCLASIAVVAAACVSAAGDHCSDVTAAAR